MVPGLLIHDFSQIILAVGAKLQAIIAKMALEIKEQHAVIQGMPSVQPGDNHFWFGSPRLVLFLINFTLFQVIVAPSLWSLLGKISSILDAN